MDKVNLDSVPYVRILVPFSIGIALSDQINAMPNKLGIVVSILSIGVFILSYLRYKHQYRWVFGSIYACFLAIFGFWYLQYRTDTNAENHFSKLQSPVTYLIGTVYDVPTVSGKNIKLPLHVESACTTENSAFQIVSGNILLYIRSESDSFRYGDRLGIRSTLIPVQSAKNAYAFDYAQYLSHQNIKFQAFAVQDSVAILSRDNGIIIWRLAYYWRTRLLKVLHKHFPTQNEFAIASALLVGYKEDLSDELRDAYAQTGSMHALAVSGTHVSMLYTSIMFFLFKLPLYGKKGRMIEAIIALLIIWTFTFITGATSSVLRATIMFSIFLVGRATFQQASIWNVLANSACILLIINPYFLFDAGFQLSYAAVCGIVYIYPLFKKNFPPVKNWFLRQVWEALLVGLSAQIGTLPLSLYYFHQFPIYFWLAGWVVIFGGAIFMAGTVLLLLFEILSLPKITAGIGFLLYKLLSFINFSIINIQHLPGSLWDGIWLSWWQCTILFMSLFSFAVALKPRRVLTSWIMTGITLLIIVITSDTIRKAEQYKQKNFTIYNINYKKRLIDFFDGIECISLSDTVLDKQQRYAAQSNRWANGIKNTYNYYLNSDSIYRNNILYNSPFIQYYQHRIVIVDNDKIWNTLALENNPYHIKINTLIASRNPRIDPKYYIQYFSPELVIIDPTNGKKKRREWIEECIKQQISYHDIKEQGSITIKI